MKESFLEQYMVSDFSIKKQEMKYLAPTEQIQIVVAIRPKNIAFVPRLPT